MTHLFKLDIKVVIAIVLAGRATSTTTIGNASDTDKVQRFARRLIGRLLLHVFLLDLIVERFLRVIMVQRPHAFACRGNSTSSNATTLIYISDGLDHYVHLTR